MSRIIRGSFVVLLVVGLVAVAEPANAVQANGAVTTADPTAHGRPIQGGSNSSCASPQPFPGTANPSDAYHHDARRFSNTSSTPQCVTVQATVGNPATAKIAAYAPSFDPADISQGFLGHIAAGFTGNDTFSFVVPAGSTFVVVVFETDANAGVSSYSLDVTDTGVHAGWGATGSITNADSTSQGRPAQSGVDSSCASPQAFPGTSLPGTVFHHDAHVFSNTSGTERCVTVQATVESPAFAKLAAYAPTFDPANLSQNFLGHITSASRTGPMPSHSSFHRGARSSSSCSSPLERRRVQLRADAQQRVRDAAVLPYGVDVDGHGRERRVDHDPPVRFGVRRDRAQNLRPDVWGRHREQRRLDRRDRGRWRPASLDGPVGRGDRAGATAEESGASEIKASVDLGGGSDTFVLQGGGAADLVTIGTGGVNLNTDGDADITLASVEAITVNGGGGNDRLEAKGGKGTGSAFTGALTLNGQVGADKLTGGTAGDTVDGGAGNDTFTSLAAADGADSFTGGAGSDTASYAPRAGAVQVLLDNLANDGASGGAEGDDITRRRGEGHGWEGRRHHRRRLAERREHVPGDERDRHHSGGVSGNDTLVGGGGADVLEGAGGKDTLNTRDGVGGNDAARGSRTSTPARRTPATPASPARPDHQRAYERSATDTADW